MCQVIYLNRLDRCCNKGGICGFNSKKGLQGIFSKDLFKCSITQVAFSYDGMYVAVTTIGGWVGIFAGKLDYELLTQFKMKAPSRVSRFKGFYTTQFHSLAISCVKSNPGSHR